MPDDRSLAVLGVGMHPWGKWGRNFVEYGIVAAQAALDDAGLAWSDVDFVAGADTIRNGYPGFIAGATFSQALGWQGNRVASCYAACASGAQALSVARAQILAGLSEVALVVGADTTPKGFFAPVGGDRPDDPDWLRFRLLGATNPTYFALYARRRMEMFGATTEDFARVRAKNSRHGAANPNARYPKEFAVDDILASPVVADPLHLLEICATSDGGAAVVLCSPEFARRHLGDTATPVRVAAISTVTPTYPQTVLELPAFATDSAAGVPAAPRPFRDAIAAAAYEEAGLGPADLHVVECQDTDAARELGSCEELGLCEPGGSAALLDSGATTLGGRLPVNPSGGLLSKGEPLGASALGQVVELVRQLRGTCGPRQVQGARVALSHTVGRGANAGVVILTR
jgi:acetyl-CoA acetyltransferase